MEGFARAALVITTACGAAMAGAACLVSLLLLLFLSLLLMLLAAFAVGWVTGLSRFTMQGFKAGRSSPRLRAVAVAL